MDMSLQQIYRIVCMHCNAYMYEWRGNRPCCRAMADYAAHYGHSLPGCGAAKFSNIRSMRIYRPVITLSYNAVAYYTVSRNIPDILSVGQFPGTFTPPPIFLPGARRLFLHITLPKCCEYQYTSTNSFTFFRYLHFCQIVISVGAFSACLFCSYIEVR